MDNFTGIFGDGDLGDLDLGVDTFGGPPGPTPVSVSDLDLGNYSQPSYTNISSNTPQQQQQPQQSIQKSGLMNTQQHQSSSGQPSYGNPPQGYQYGPSPGSQQQPQPPISQFSMGGQYRPPYHPQDIYGAGPMQTGQSLPSWGTTPDPYGGSAQPGYAMPGPGARTMPGYQGASMQGLPNTLPQQSQQPPPQQPSNIPPNFSGMPNQHMPSQGFQTQQAGPYPGAPQPPYPGYDPQRAVGPNSSLMYGNSPGPPPQQYGLPQPPQQQYSGYSQQPPQNQMMTSHGAPGDMGRQYTSPQHPQSSSHQLPNGSPAYRPSYTPSGPQMSPHPQMSSHPQMSPRSVSSPHPHPVSSPIPNPPSSMSNTGGTPNIGTSSSSGAGGSSLQHLENMVKPTMPSISHQSSVASGQTSLQSPMYSTGSSIPSPIGSRPPMSPGLVRQAAAPPMSPVMSPRPPMSPQQWPPQPRPTSQGYNMQPGYMGPMPGQRGLAPNISSVTSVQDNLRSESIVSASDSSKLTSNCGNVNSAAQLNGPLSNVSVNNSNVNSSGNSIVSDSVKDMCENSPISLNVNGPSSGKLSIPANVPQTSSGVPIGAMDSLLPSSVAPGTSTSIPNASHGGCQQQQQGGIRPVNNTGNTMNANGMPMTNVASNGMMSHHPVGPMPRGPYPQQYRMSGAPLYRPNSPMGNMPQHQNIGPRQMVPGMPQQIMSQHHAATSSSMSGMNTAAMQPNSQQMSSIPPQTNALQMSTSTSHNLSTSNSNHMNQFNLPLSNIPSTTVSQHPNHSPSQLQSHSTDQSESGASLPSSIQPSLGSVSPLPSHNSPMMNSISSAGSSNLTQSPSNHSSLSTSESSKMQLAGLVPGSGSGNVLPSISSPSSFSNMSVRSPAGDGQAGSGSSQMSSQANHFHQGPSTPVGQVPSEGISHGPYSSPGNTMTASPLGQPSSGGSPQLPMSTSGQMVQQDNTSQVTLSSHGQLRLTPGSNGSENMMAASHISTTQNSLGPIGSGPPGRQQAGGPITVMAGGPATGQVRPGGPTQMRPVRPSLMGPVGSSQIGSHGPMQMGPSGVSHMGPVGFPLMGPNGPSQMGPSGHQMGPGGPQMGPGGPQGPGPQMGPGGSQIGPGGPQMGPGGPQMGPGGPQMGPGGPQRGPGGPQRGLGGPQMGLGGPQMGPCGPQMGPGGPQMGPGGSQMGPGGPQMRPGGPQIGPGGLMHMEPRGPQMSQGGPIHMVPGGPSQQMGPGEPHMRPAIPPHVGPGGPMQMAGPSQIRQAGPITSSQMGPSGPMTGSPLSGPGDLTVLTASGSSMQATGPAQMGPGGLPQIGSSQSGPAGSPQLGQGVATYAGPEASAPMGSVSSPQVSGSSQLGAAPIGSCVPTTLSLGNAGPGQVPHNTGQILPNMATGPPGIPRPNLSTEQMGTGMRPIGPLMMGPRGPVGPMGPLDSCGMTSMSSVGPHAMTPTANLSFEIQQCQQQLQQLYKMPQNMQMQQQINEVQQRLGQLQQQQQQFMQPQTIYQTPPGPTPALEGSSPNTPEPGTPTPKKKRVRAPPKPKTPKEPKPKKESKPKKEPTVKAPKEPVKEKEAPEPKAKRVRNRAKVVKDPAEPKTPRKRSARGKKNEDAVAPPAATAPSEPDADTPTPAPEAEEAPADGDSLVPADGTDDASEDKATSDKPLSFGAALDQSAKDPALLQKLKKPPRVRSAASSKKKPAAKLSLPTKRKRKRRGSESDFSDNDESSKKKKSKEEEEEDDDPSKRRSGRNQGSRKKYIDELDLDLSDEDEAQAAAAAAAISNGPEGDKPNMVYVDPNNEDSMVVQFILNMRMGEREIVSDSEDEEDEATKGDAKPAEAVEDKEESKSEPADAATPSKEVEEQKSCAAIDTIEEKSEAAIEVTEAKEITTDNAAASDTVVNGVKEAPAADIPESNENEAKSDGADKPERQAEVAPVDQPTKDDSQPTSDAPAEDDNPKDDSTEAVAVNEDLANVEKTKKSVNFNESKEAANTSVFESPRKKKATGPARKIEVEEFFVKYKNFSYLHCDWRTEEELMRGDKRIAGKIRRYTQKRCASMNLMDFLEEESFNPDYIEVDRVLDMSETTMEGGKMVVHYLVKWKALPYEDATWELEDDVDIARVEEFKRFKDPPPRNERKIRKRPSPSEWKKLEQSPIYKNDNSLREYQLEGLNWLNFSYHNTHNCILADEMGLGKTIQSLSFVDSCFKAGVRGPFLVIAPLSTIPNWQREFESWTDLNVIVYHGSQASRNMIMEYEMYYKDDKGTKVPNIFKFNVLITTFEVIITDCVELKEINWRVCIIDEAHRLKNRNCKLLEGLRLMHLEHRVLLSGTPLQNNVTELFSLLNFLEPTQFADPEAFMREFGKLESEEQVKKLQALLKPMMLRRMKEDVEKSLAPKEETIIEVELTNIQKKYYRAILEKNFEFLNKGASYTNVPSLMNTMMELRKCCLHPYLLNGAEETIQSDYKEMIGPSVPESIDVYHNAIIQSSGKMVLVDKLLPRLKQNGHRVLIFSQMVKLLDIIEDYLIFRKFPYERLDGRIRGNLRQAAIDRFCKPDSDRFVFLLCTKAGGLGINLTAADTVIIYDSDWNPQNDLQAQARCHRIGQKKNVKIYRLLCRNTYEREMFDKASLKLGLDRAVLQSMNTDAKPSAAGGNALGLSKKDIEDLLKKGAYGALMDEDTGDDFCEEDIDQILQRRTTVIQHESEKGSSFSKASFSASTNRNDIDLEDPDFWKKWAKKADIDTEVQEKTRKLVLEEPRRRSQIRRYGHDEAAVDCSDLESSDTDKEGKEPQEEEEEEDASAGELNTRSCRSGKYRPRGGRGRGRGGRGGRWGSRTSKWQPEEEVSDTEEVRYGYWSRSECFKVEKGLLTYGWARWKEILKSAELRSAWGEVHVQECARMILLYCIKFYKGDDKIKGFIFDLIAPTEDGETRVHRNHIGLSAPVPRGRKGKKKLREAKMVASLIEGSDWAKDDKYDPEIHLDQGYSRHLTRHANKVLLRVRLLFYIKQEIVGELAEQIENGAKSGDIAIYPPSTELPPKPWWDTEADKCLLVGVFKHGYDRYSVMRNDPALCFLARCGPPDKAALQAEMTITVNEEDMDKDDKEDKDEEKEDEDSNHTPLPSSPAVSCSTTRSEDDKSDEKDKDDPSKQFLSFPSASDINGRLRRVVTSYQRSNRKIELRNEAKGFDHYLADKILRRERMAEYIRERELRRSDYNQRRWSNREQAEFYRTISTYGVEYIRKEKRYDWTKFRQLSRLDKKYDETLSEYFRAFMAMCKRQCGIRLSEGENAKIYAVGVDRLPEERARRVLERVDLLNRLRNDVLPSPALDGALRLALPSRDMPDWWIPDKHDRDLIKGVARHGLGRTDYYILYDSVLCFREIIRRHNAGEPLITNEEKTELMERFFPEQLEKERKKANQQEQEEKVAADQVKQQDKVAVELTKEKDEGDADQAKEKEIDLTEQTKEKEATEPVEQKDMDVVEKEENTAEGGDESETAKQEESLQEEVAVGEEKQNETTGNESMGDETSPEQGEKSDVINGTVEQLEKDENIDKEGNCQNETGEKMDVDNEPVDSKGPVPTDQPMEAETVEDNSGEDDTVKVEPSDGMEEEQQSDETTAADPKKETSDEGPDVEPANLEHDPTDAQLTNVASDLEEKPVVKKDVESIITKLELLETKKEEVISTEDLKSESLGKAEDSKSSIPVVPLEEEDIKNKDNALLSLQQMDEAMAKLGAANMDPLATTEPTVAQLLAQSAANPIKWPKERAIQNRVEHIMYAVEKNRWPVDKYFQTSESESRDVLTSQQQQQLHQHQLQQHHQQQLQESERQQRAVDVAEMERVQLQALLHPNLHHTLGLSKGGLTASSLRNFLESEGREKLSQSDSNALRQLQALQGSLDLTIRPVSSSGSGSGQGLSDQLSSLGPPPRRGPGRPRLDDPMRAAEKRMAEQLQHLQPQEKKRRKLDEIVMGLTSKSKSPEQIISAPKDSNPLSLLRGSSVSLLSSRDKSILTNAISSPRLSTSISISQSCDPKRHDSRHDDRGTPSKSQTDGGRLVSKTDLPPGISLPPGIELYRPTESKVDKWLEQHQGLLAESSPNKESSAAAAKRRRLEDWSNQLTGEEHVPLIHSKTGQKVSGADAPKLKQLQQWLMEHPGFEVDPHWVESMSRERLPSLTSSFPDIHKRLADKRYHPSSGPSTPVPVSSPAASHYQPSPSPKSMHHDAYDLRNPLTLAALTGIDPKILASLDPKALAGLDPKLLNAFKSPSMDSKLLASMGLDPKFFGMPTSRHQEIPKPSTSQMSRNDSRMFGGIDPKLLAGLDPKVLASLDPKLLATLLDPKCSPHGSGPSSSSMGGSNTRNSSPSPSGSTSGASKARASAHHHHHQQPPPIDYKMLAAMDPKMLQQAGIDPKLLSSMMGVDPKMFGFDPKAMSAYGLDPKMLASLGMDPKMLASLDPKLLGSLGLDPKMFSGIDSHSNMGANMDPKSLQGGLGGLDPKMLASLGLDQKTLANLDPKILQSLGIDPKLFACSSNDQPKMPGNLDPKLLASLGLDPKMMASLDPKLLASIGIDPKSMANLGFDSKMLASAGIDPKMFMGTSFDPKLMGAAAGLDPRMFAGLDPKVLASLGIDPRLLGGFDPKAYSSQDSKHCHDPKTSGFDPMMLASLGLDMKTLAGLDPKLLASQHQKLSGMDQKPPRSRGRQSESRKAAAAAAASAEHKQLIGGIDPSLLAGMDPKMLASLGIDPKMFANLDKKHNTNKERKAPPMPGLDVKSLGAFDPKNLSSFDPKMLASLGAMDPKLLASMYAGLDPKMLSALDPRLMGSLDPKVLASMGVDPTMMMMMAGMPGMANPFMTGLPGFGLPGLGLPNMPSSSESHASASKSKDGGNSSKNSASSSQSNLLSGMFGGASAAGLLYPHLAGLPSFPGMPPSSSALLNGLTVTTSSRSDRQEHDPRSSPAATKQSQKDKAGTSGLSKEERNILKQMKAGRLAREMETSQLLEPPQDLSSPKLTQPQQDQPENLSRATTPGAASTVSAAAEGASETAEEEQPPQDE